MSVRGVLRHVCRISAAGTLAGATLAFGQTAPARTSQIEPKDEQPVRLSALRTKEEIMKVPQSITVLTRDIIDDIASIDLSDMLNYVGIGNFQQGDSAYVRGNNAPINTDGAGDGSPSMAPDAARCADKPSFS